MPTDTPTFAKGVPGGSPQPPRPEVFAKGLPGKSAGGPPSGGGESAKPSDPPCKAGPATAPPFSWPVNSSSKAGGPSGGGHLFPPEVTAEPKANNPLAQAKGVGTRPAEDSANASPQAPWVQGASFAKSSGQATPAMPGKSMGFAKAQAPVPDAAAGWSNQPLWSTPKSGGMGAGKADFGKGDGKGENKGGDAKGEGKGDKPHTKPILPRPPGKAGAGKDEKSGPTGGYTPPPWRHH